MARSRIRADCRGGLPSPEQNRDNARDESRDSSWGEAAGSRLRDGDISFISSAHAGRASWQEMRRTTVEWFNSLSSGRSALRRSALGLWERQAGTLSCSRWGTKATLVSHYTTAKTIVSRDDGQMPAKGVAGERTENGGYKYGVREQKGPWTDAWMVLLVPHVPWRLI
ncbi:hypothetical protein BDW22DRAFT_792000 [Trametopsis cervina]|nr:hypothetical protein BDW22DRAFT_792000 [Trametopsis cervina]